MFREVKLGGPAKGPLSGVRVADFSAVFSGPICASILADQGADVIKIESFEGDLMRRGLPQQDGMGSAFVTMNRNKRSLALDLSSAPGKAIASKLILSCDVVIENFRPGVMDRLELGYSEFQKEHPKLVYVSINGVGAVGPYSGRRVYDAVIQAISGFSALKGDEKPEMVDTLICDKITSLTAAEATVAALFQAERSGKGQLVEVSMLDSALSFLWPDTMNNFTFLDGENEWVDYLDHSVFLHETKDGWIATMPVQDREVKAAFKALELDELIEDPRFVDQPSRARHRSELRALANEAYGKFTTDELCEKLEAEDVPYSRLNNRKEVIQDPQIEAMGALLKYEDPGAGSIRTPRPPAQFNETPSNIRRAAPRLGEHSREVLAEIGYPEEEIQTFINQKIVTSGT